MRPFTAVVLVLLVAVSVGGAGPRPAPPVDESCLTEAVPDPDSLEAAGNVTPRAYPAFPSDSRETDARDFLRAFERAYLVNTFLATEDDEVYERYWVEYGLLDVRGTATSYEVELVGYTALYFEDGGHGDGTVEVTYHVDGTTVRRDDRDEPGPGTAVFDCPA